MSRADSRRFHRLRLRAEVERRHIDRAQAKERARSAARTRARFVVETAIESGVRIAIVGDPGDPTVFTWAPTAPDDARAIACQDSFKTAVEGSLDEVIALAESEL